jgi:2-isopropylmalate synthase
MDTVHIFDTTLRDGEQSPGFSMNREEKLKLAHALEELGVDVLEAGFPIASPGDLEATRAVAAEIKGCRVAALARARQDDVDAALRGLEPAAKPRLHLFLATSDLHLKHKLRSSREQALDQITKMIRYGRQHCEEIEFSAEDASRTDFDYSRSLWPPLNVARPSLICPTPWDIRPRMSMRSYSARCAPNWPRTLM